MPGKTYSWAYFDTSVLAKTYIEERGSQASVELLKTYTVLSSALTLVELVSALRRRRATDDITGKQMDLLLSRLDEDRRSWTLVTLGVRVLARAERMCRDLPLRALDALHAASALVFLESSGLRIPFVTADARQREAAAASGLEVLWVG